MLSDSDIDLHEKLAKINREIILHEISVSETINQMKSNQREKIKYLKNTVEALEDNNILLDDLKKDSEKSLHQYTLEPILPTIGAVIFIFFLISISSMFFS